MHFATCYEEWRDAAIAFDESVGNDRWRRTDRTDRYDYVSIRTRLDRLRSLRARHDNKKLLYALNEGIHGNMGGMGRPSLYSKALYGTKHLVSDYVEEIASALEYLASDAVDDIQFEEKLDFFRRAHHCFGRSALMMSGSGTFFYFHLGVVKALYEQGVLPDTLSGSSGGALVGSMVSTRDPESMAEIFDPEYVAYEPADTRGFLKSWCGLKPQMVRAEDVPPMFQRLLPDLTFQEAFELTGRNLNISIAAAETHQTSRLLNAVTSPTVFIREAVLASSAVPGLIPPVVLSAKDSEGLKQAYLPSRKWVDGSVSDDMPTKRLSRLYGINHYVVSQTNPHVIPFVSDTKKKHDAASIIKTASSRTAREWINAGAGLTEKRLNRAPSLKRVINTGISMINQDYMGDINILPSNRLINPLTVLTFQPVERIRELIVSGEKATWPKIEMIRIQTRISRTLDDILGHYENIFAGEQRTSKSKPIQANRVR